MRNQAFIEDRIWYIEWLLLTKGWFSRHELMEKFSIQEAAASRDIRRYKEMASENLFLNQSVKRYEINLQTFKPAFPISGEVIFAKLTDPDESKLLGASDSLIEPIPRLAKLDEKLADITRAILNKKIIKITYLSMSSGESVKDIAPHSMFDNDLKTYVRCYDFARSKFLDLVVGRIYKIHEDEYDASNDVLEDQDSDWNEFLDLELCVHPRIEHKKAIELDMGMVNGVKKITVRKSLAHYWMRRWCVDCSEHAVMKDTAYQLHLKNADVIKGVHGYFPGVNNHADSF